jgi:hypothetical protein
VSSFWTITAVDSPATGIVKDDCVRQQAANVDIHMVVLNLDNKEWVSLDTADLVNEIAFDHRRLTWIVCRLARDRVRSCHHH